MDGVGSFLVSVGVGFVDIVDCVVLNVLISVIECDSVSKLSNEEGIVFCASSSCVNIVLSLF